MKLILAGCEYAGKHTLGIEINRWWCDQVGQKFQPPPACHFHDHFVLPHIVHAEGHEHHKKLSESQILTLNPHLLEHYQRYQLFNKLTPGYCDEDDLFLMDYHIGEAVYAPMYYEYGKPGMYADRRKMARNLEVQMLKLIPDVILVLVKTTADTIRERMGDVDSTPFPGRHAGTFFKGEDAEIVLERYEEEFENSHIRKKFVIDTTNISVHENLKEFATEIKPFINPQDWARIAGHKAL